MRKLNLESRTKREIVIEDFRGFGKLVVPKGTWLSVYAQGREFKGTSVTVDAYVGGDSVLYGVEIDVNDIERHRPSDGAGLIRR